MYAESYSKKRGRAKPKLVQTAMVSVCHLPESSMIRTVHNFWFNEIYTSFYSSSLPDHRSFVFTLLGNSALLRDTLTFVSIANLNELSLCNNEHTRECTCNPHMTHHFNSSSMSVYWQVLNYVCVNTIIFVVRSNGKFISLPTLANCVHWQWMECILWQLILDVRYINRLIEAYTQSHSQLN